MDSIVIQAANKEELNIVSNFLRPHHIKNYLLTDERKEDLVLSKLMSETDNSDTVDTADFLKEMRGK